MIITELAVFKVKPTGGLVLIELHEGVDIETVRAKTGWDFEVALGSE